MEALNGSCLEIPCRFKPKDENRLDSRRPIFGIWIIKDVRFLTNPKNVVYNSSGTTVYPMKIIGDLSQKNCTTVFSNLTTDYTDKYFFRVENENTTWKASASCDPVQIAIRGKRFVIAIVRRGTLFRALPLRSKYTTLIICPAYCPILSHDQKLECTNLMVKREVISFAFLNTT